MQSIEHVLGLYDYRLELLRDIADFESPQKENNDLAGAGQVEANVLLSEEVLSGPI